MYFRVRPVIVPEPIEDANRSFVYRVRKCMEVNGDHGETFTLTASVFERIRSDSAVYSIQWNETVASMKNVRV